MIIIAQSPCITGRLLSLAACVSGLIMFTFLQPVSLPPFRHPYRDDVFFFTGRCFTNNVQGVTERLLAGEVPKDIQCPINILLFHGSLDGYTGGDVFFPGKHTAPFSVSELSNLAFSYAALGHYHDLTEISVARESTVLGAYSGCLVGRGLDRPSPSCFVCGN